MSLVVELLCSRRIPHVAVLALMSFGFAGCSADMQTRLSQSSFSNPFASQPEATGSVPTTQVERRELPQYARPQSQYPQDQSQALPPPISAPQSYPVAGRGVSGGGRGLSSYAPPNHQPIETTGPRKEERRNHYSPNAEFAELFYTCDRIGHLHPEHRVHLDGVGISPMLVGSHA